MRTRQVEQRPRPPQTAACGNAGDAAHLEDRVAGGLRHAAPLAVVEAHDAGAPFPEVAQGPRGDRADQQGKRRIFQAGGDRVEVGDLPGRRDARALEQAARESRDAAPARRHRAARRRRPRGWRRGSAGRGHREAAASRDTRASGAARSAGRCSHAPRRRAAGRTAAGCPASRRRRASPAPRGSPTGRRRASPRGACRRHGPRPAG